MNQTLLMIVVVVLVLVLTALAPAIRARLASSLNSSATAEYEARGSLLTAAERSFFGVLDQCTPTGVGLLAKVRLGDIVTARRGLEVSKRTSAGNRINQKHVDFLLVRISDMVPLAGIELDDKSHEAPSRRKRDALVDRAFSDASLPLLHVKAQHAYDVAQVRQEIDELLKLVTIAA